MSEESTAPDPEEAVRRSMQALSRRDYDGALAPLSVHAEMDTTAAGALEVFEGRMAIREFFEVWRGPYEDFELELEEFHDHGNGVTLSVIAQRGRPPGSSSFVSVRGGHVAVWRDGLIERNTVFLDIDQARAAAERLAQERG
jgi:ketosteroid isomerase-like protein